MISRPLMSPDELKTLPKGHFILAKTGCCPMQTQLPLFLKWKIAFEDPYEVPERAARKVFYADRFELEREIVRRRDDDDGFDDLEDFPAAASAGSSGGQLQMPASDHKRQSMPSRRMPLRTD